MAHDNNTSNLLVYMAISLFLFNDTLRGMISMSPLNVKFNLLFIFIGILAISYLFIKRYIDIRIIILATAITGFALIAVYRGISEMPQYVKIITTIFMPVIIIGIRLPLDDIELVIIRFLKVFNYVCIVLVVVGIIDYLSGARIQTFFADSQLYREGYSALVYTEQSKGIYRYYSFVGHPLTTAWYLLVFYTLNILTKRIYGKTLLNEYLLIIITFIGLLLCGSRTALIVGLFMFIFLNNNPHKVALFSGISIFSAILFSTSLFRKNLLQRFLLNKSNVSGGRNDALEWVFKGFVNSPNFWTGGGLSSSYQVTMNMGFITNFEYPFIMFAYDIGILSTILIYVAILLIPLYIFVRNKNYQFVIFFLLITMYLNGSNDLVSYYDYFGQLCFIIMAMINMSYHQRPAKNV